MELSNYPTNCTSNFLQFLGEDLHLVIFAPWFFLGPREKRDIKNVLPMLMSNLDTSYTMSTYVNAVYTGYLLEVNMCLMLEVSQLFGTVVTGLVWRLPCGFKIGRFYGWKRKPPGKFYINIFSDHPCLQICHINSPNWLLVYLECVIFGEIDMLMCNIHNFGALDSQIWRKQKRVSRHIPTNTIRVKLRMARPQFHSTLR